MIGRLYLTENCNASCSWCFNKNVRNPDLNMDTKKLKKLIDFFAENNVSKLLVMGGEPTIHPNFIEIWNYIYDKFKYVTLYTNGTQKDILKQINISKTNNGINYNFNFINNPLDVEYHKQWEGVSYEIVVSTITNIPDLIKRIEKCYTEDINLNLIPTIDCTLNIFKNKEIIQSKISELFDYIAKHPEYNWSFDHTYPRCVLTPELMNKVSFFRQVSPDIYERNLCSSLIGDSGLILSNFKLVHCNQYRNQYLDIFDSEGNIAVTMDDILKFLFFEGVTKLQQTPCKDCEYFPTKCNGGCVALKNK